MDCGQLAGVYEEYALGVLEGEERVELEAHLARGCAQCTRGLERARWVVAQLAAASPEAHPPESLRRKIMNAAGGSPRAAGSSAKTEGKRPLFPAWAWAAAAALALITGYAVRQMQVDTGRLRDLRQQVRIAELRNRDLQERLALGQMVTSVMMSPDSMPLKLMPKDRSMPMVHAYLHPNMGVALTAEKMPEMPPARTLQLWYMPKKGQPVSLGTFKPDAQGQVQMVAPVHVPMDQIAALEISEEPAGGSPEPTESPAWVAQLR
jgi:anti-sigma-K factor RskA